ncbi:MAG: secretin and TonB N-terminal domain-containing protein, partial [Candidatus Omnitrophica bacterium]|nr:secretin and TonB N-terminal domain-containing protein [Candidatus Omnitrophota bacterium]
LFLIIFFMNISNLSSAIDNDDLGSLLYPEYTKTISMDFKNAQLKDVLKIFSQQAGLNFIASSNIANKTIDLYLENVPVEAALERILSANNLKYEIKPGTNIFIVQENTQLQQEIMTRVYPLKHATVTTSKINTTLSSDDEGEGSSGSSGQSQVTGIITAIEKLLSEHGSVVEDARTNSLIVSDIPSVFPLIEQTISRLDIRTPQILIEMEMLDIAKDTADLLGAKFGDSPVTFSGAEKLTLFPFNTDNVFDDVVGLDGQRTFAGEPESGFTAGKVSFAGLNFTLNFLRTQGDTRSLARPRILTLNNETAEIQILTDEVIGVTANITSSQSTSQTTTEAERSMTGVSLKVTPQANVHTSEITLAIEPTVMDARPSSGIAGAANFKDPETRSTRSILRVRDGDTIIMGGLLRNEVVDVRSKVPFISNVPILGMAFRHKNKEESQRELIIFITPHIVKESLSTASTEDNLKDIIREQSMPSYKQDKIDKELSYFEK